jgi:hypothetical protein
MLPFPTGILEVQAISLALSNTTTISILNIYNPNGQVTLQELMPDATGRALEDLLLSKHLTLVNPVDFYTYIDCQTGNLGCLDLVLVSSDVSPSFNLQCLPDVGSDHFPIMATSGLSLLNLDSVSVPQWRLAPNGLQQIPSSILKSTLPTPAFVDEQVTNSPQE